MAKHGDIDHTGITGVPDAEAFDETAHDAHDHTGVPGVGGGAGGAILQVVTAVSTTTDTTTSTTLVDSSLSAVITPLAADSKLIITVDGECRAERAALTPVARYLHVAIYNSTNSVLVVEQFRGRNLDAANAAAAISIMPIALRGIYTVNSLAARTFKLQFKTVTDLTCSIRGEQPGGVLMTIMEIAA